MRNKKMVLRYMLSDTDLAKGEVLQPEKEVVHPPKAVVRPIKNIPSPQKKRVTFWFILAANVILCGVVYYLWTAGEKPPALEFLAANKVTVTGIIYNVENPSAIVSGEVVHEGDMIDGCRVVKISEAEVEFEKNGKYFTKHVRR